METYTIAMGNGGVQTFQVSMYPHHQQPVCRYSIFQEGKLMASLSPDSQNFLNICQNPGGISDDVLDLLCEAIELRHPYNIPDAD